MILPLSYAGRPVLVQNSLLSLWVDLNIPKDIAAGEYALKFTLKDKSGDVLAEKEITAEIINAVLPDEPFLHTEWLYADCISEYYDVEMFGERHFEILKNFIKTAADNEINVILTPVFTPALDTYVGGERTTSQLVDITLEGGKYSFNFSNLEKWVSMCRELGICRFELPPFFTQWGAEHAPKIVADVNGEGKRIFGWETDAYSAEYKEFLRAFIPALLVEFKKLGVQNEDLFFHISDEPKAENLEKYKTTLEIIKELLEGYRIIDAVGDVELLEKGALSTPVISTDSVAAFKEKGAKDYWVYYHGGLYKDISNRFMAMPLARTRIIGVQLYKDNAVGFLHWGYNYYHNRYSYDTVNPFLETGGEYFGPSGDTFIVYPGEKGMPLESIRLKAIRDAMQDIKALKLCEKLYGREYVINLIEQGLDYGLDYKHYPHDDCYLTELRNKVNRAIGKKTTGVI